MKTVVVWPSDNEVKRTESAFHEFAGFPGIIGATDGCHVSIVVPEAGLWSRSRCLGLKTVLRRIRVSSRSRLDENYQHLHLVSVIDVLCP